ncbi:multidrug resistance-associated protein 1-like isoform X2 [Mercenaria mercenaria]|uniref:multidrug resistance-associated protein 1-like isoform X2 n=1 Tax=Mercenaria mercenaria TaxID=6596 RepID=UPI00234F916E|nr:multidrug resistance-associated protein 1-like isoform X2 [Mercenaria mercenaria]
MDSMFYEFCGNLSFLNKTILLQDQPILTSCFLDTLPVWITCGFLWIASPPFVVFMLKCCGKPLPFSHIHVVKIAVCITLICLEELHFLFRLMYGPMCEGLQTLPLSAMVAMGVRTGTLLLATLLIEVQKRHGIRTSGVLFAFWFLLITTESFRFYSYLISQLYCVTHVVFYIYYAFVVVQFIVHCFSDKAGLLPSDKVPCPQDHASTLNRITYTWMTSLVYSVYKKTFQRETMWNQTYSLQSSLIGTRLEMRWKREIEKKRERTERRDNVSVIVEPVGDLSTSCNSECTPLLSQGERQEQKKNTKSGRANLLKVVLLENWFELLEFLFYSWFSLITYCSLPLILSYLIDFIDAKDTSTSPLWLGIIYCLIVVISMETSSIFYNAQCHYAACLGLKIKHSLMYLIYQKALTVSKAENKISVGDVVNHMSVDCQRIQDSVFYSYYLPNCILFLTIASYFLYVTVGGPATIGGMCLLCMIVPLNVAIVRAQKTIQENLLHIKGVRVRLMSEILSGIKVLKMYAWEYTFIQKIQDIRKKEIEYLRKNATLMAISTSVANHSQYMAYVSLKRVEDFLCCSDVDDAEITLLKPAGTLHPDYSVYVRDGTFTWDSEDADQCLSRINLKVRAGQLIAVVGYCGSGKSSLISAILGEMRRLGGYTQIKGSVAYVPQEAWIQNMTLRDNILFGRHYNHSKYWKVIENCSLKSDLEMLDGGDKTEIGEKGTNISGGQKQRISVARAVYSNADIYFLDDPLSAVDAHVGKDLFKNVIGNSGMLKNKTRILVTHTIHWLPLVDNIIVMNEGKISECGTYDELMLHNGPFAQFLLQNLQNEAAEDCDDPEIQWIRENMIEQIESVTSEGADGNSSEDTASRVKGKRQKKKRDRRRNLSSMSMSRMPSTQISMTTQNIKRLTTEEVVQEGSVKLEVLVDYFKAMGLWVALISVLLLVFYHVLTVYSMFWLTFWTEDPFLKNRSNAVLDEYADKSTKYMIVYVLMCLIQGVAVFVSYYLSLNRLIQASSVLHSKMLMSVMRSPMSFFDSVPIGRILNRFSSDIDTLDNKLPESYRVWINMFLTTVSAIVVIVISTPIFILVVLPTVAIIIGLIYFYLPTTRKMRRIEAVTRSPIYNFFSETLTGSSVIRAYKCCNRFIQEFFRRNDENSTYYFAANTGSRWIAMRIEFLGNIILLAAIMIAITSDTLNGGQLGLSVTYAVQITFSLNTVVWSVTEMEMNVVSAERVNEFSDLPSEAEWKEDKVVPRKDWPATGNISYRKYCTRYRAGLDLVLKGITFNIQNGEKIGVVGRTGAGKSSLTLSLFRIIEASGGSIYIDGVNIANLGLHTLRRNITILPQEPVLFSGSLKMNVDPLNQFTDDEIWGALECAHLKSFAAKQPEGLLYDCGEAGQNFSVGQRQLVCLARTLLNKTKVLVLDEATAAVDLETDSLIQQTIRTQFSDCTIFTIAHRLNTIMDYDRVMVLDKGLIKEFAAPRELLNDREGIFHSMAKDARLI